VRDFPFDMGEASLLLCPRLFAVSISTARTCCYSSGGERQFGQVAALPQVL
jgi:hypothetical protein